MCTKYSLLCCLKQQNIGNSPNADPQKSGCINLGGLILPKGSNISHFKKRTRKASIKWYGITSRICYWMKKQGSKELFHMILFAWE